MFRQQFARLLHPVDDARREFRFAKVPGHRVRKLPPKFIPAFCMDGFITDDGKLMRPGSHKNQHAVLFGGLVHAEAQKFRLRGGNGIINVFGADADADLAGGLEFGVPDCRDNGVVVQVPGESSRVHKLPVPSCSATAKAAPAAGKSTAGKSAAAGKSTAGKSAAAGIAATPTA
jgi:hypothetical protein